ncbi:FkbM family methyltransferase [Pseudodesulfovibrio sp. S3-i]|nr:FkbM family methyltransferase [Pseudodesulfovibrio sp. S3-i]
MDMKAVTDTTINDLIEELLPKAHAIVDDFGDGVTLYGQGVVGQWGASHLSGVGAAINCIIDNAPDKQGTTYKAIPTLRHDDGIGRSRSLLISARHHVQPIAARCAPHYANIMSLDAFVIVTNRDRIAQARDMFEDDGISRRSYNAVIHALLSNSLEQCYPVLDNNMYFSVPQFACGYSESFVDAGAYVGDTLEKFIWKCGGSFESILAFEPGARQFAAMKERIRRLRVEWALGEGAITAVQGALADKNGHMAIDKSGLPTSNHGAGGVRAQSADTVPIHRLDDFIGDRRVTMIKMDVEGMEAQLLSGARQTIARQQPKLAVCAYHYPVDLFSLAENVQEIAPSYRFAFRWHTPVLGDYVLYCY